MFRFASPYFLTLLLFVPLSIWYGRRRQAAAMAHPGIAPTADLTPSAMLRLGRMIPALYYLTLILMVTALARPQWGTREVIMNSRGINIVLTMDLSQSMAALDFKLGDKIVNRLTAIKSVVQDFIGRRTGDRIGLVVFGSHAYTQLPLTRDYHTIATILDRLRIGAAGRSTAIGDAIGIALKRLADIPSRSNIIILLTDGRSNSGELEPLTAAHIAREKGVKIYTIGVGGRGQSPFLVHDPIFGDRYVYQRVDLDEESLQEIAQQTGGHYFRAADTEGLQKIYHTIDQLEKNDAKVKTFAQYNELYIYLLAPALFLLGAWIVLRNTRFLIIP